MESELELRKVTQISHAFGHKAYNERKSRDLDKHPCQVVHKALSHSIGKLRESTLIYNAVQPTVYGDGLAFDVFDGWDVSRNHVDQLVNTVYNLIGDYIAVVRQALFSMINPDGKEAQLLWGADLPFQIVTHDP